MYKRLLKILAIISSIHSHKRGKKLGNVVSSSPQFDKKKSTNTIQGLNYPVQKSNTELHWHAPSLFMKSDLIVASMLLPGPRWYIVSSSTLFFLKVFVQLLSPKP